MKRLFLFRPEPGWSISAESARAMGMEVGGAPLFTIEPVDWNVPAKADFDGLLVGSANVFRHAGKGLDALVQLPVHVVGDATADAARAAGFLVGRQGHGGLQSLLDELGGRALRLLRLAGEDRVALALPAGIEVSTEIVYRTVPGEISESDAAALRGGGVIALHSGAAAERVASNFDRLCLDRGVIEIVAIGSRVAAMAGTGWASVHIAGRLDDTHVLELARSLCQAD